MKHVAEAHGIMRWLWIGAFALLSAAPAAGDQYWIAYEGNDLPENEGWTRQTHGSGAVRTVSDGALTIDSLGSTEIADYAVRHELALLEDGETFVVEWCVQVEQSTPFLDAGVAIGRPGLQGDIGIDIGADRVRIVPGFAEIAIDPGVFHSYRLESGDFDHFDLYIDGDLAHTGRFASPSIVPPMVAFGDPVIGSSSLSHWDRFAFGVIPEPSSRFLFISTIPIFMVSGRRRQR